MFEYIIIMGFFDFITDGFNAVENIGKKVLDGAKSVGKKALDSVATIGKKIITPVSDFIEDKKDIINSVGSAISTVGGALNTAGEATGFAPLALAGSGLGLVGSGVKDITALNTGIRTGRYNQMGKEMLSNLVDDSGIANIPYVGGILAGGAKQGIDYGIDYLQDEIFG